MALRFRARAALVIGLVGLVAAACGDDADTPAVPGEDTTTTAPAATDEPRSGGTLTMAVFSEPAGLDPVVIQGGGTGGNHELGAIYDTLMRYDADTGTYVPQLAESLTPNDDHTEWTLRLRPGVTFTDGTDFDAEAVVFGLQRHTRYGSTLAGMVASIADYVVVDELTVRFELAQPWPNFPYVLSHTAGMIPSPTALREACPDPEEPPRDCVFNTEPVGAGPFMVESYRPREALVLTRNPDYWGGPAHLDGLRFVPPQAAGIIYEQITTDAIQVGFLRDEQTIRQAIDEGRVQTYEVLMGFGRILLINNGQIMCRNGLPAAVCDGRPDGIIDMGKPTGDVRVRQAISYAVDPVQLDERMTAGTGFPGREFFPPGTRFATGPSGEYDPERASELLEEAKADLGWDGSLTVRCLQEQATSAPFVQTVQAMLNAAGFRVETELSPATEYITSIQATRDYDLACWGFNVAEEAPEAGLSRHVLSVEGGNAGGNAMNLNNPDIDAQVLAIRRAGTDEERRQGFDALLELWQVEQPSIVYGSTPEVIAYHSRVNGLKFNVATSVLFDQAWLG